MSPQRLDALRLTEGHASALKKLGEFRGRQELFRRQIPELLDGLKTAAIVESSESSNRLEGIHAPHDRIEALVRESTTPRNRSEQEIAGYRDALNLVHESARDMAFSTNVILQLHSMLYRYLPQPGGRWKMAQNEIVERTHDGLIHRVRFVPPGPVETPGLIEDLVQTYGRAIDAGREPLIAVPLAVLDFLCIHPFADGNGRVARLITLQLLYQHDFTIGRYLSLERIFEATKEGYYRTLEASSAGWHEGRNDVHAWLAYFWSVLLRAYQEFEERVGTLRTGKGAKTDLVEQAIARRRSPFAISDIEADCPGVSRDWIRLVLRRLKAEGRIAPQGKGRGAKWIRTEK